MTRIRKVVKKQYYMKIIYQNSKTSEPKTKYKRKYERIVYMLQFPKSFNVTDFLDKELAFEKKDGTIIIRTR